jgi:hypothetical protein
MMHPSTFLLLLLALQGIAQNETKKWYFGKYAGLDFTTNPPTILGASSMSASEGCSSISDQQGNLLFYAYPETVWNKSHSVMANGSGLLGNFSASQGALILRQPGSSNLYYLFTLDADGLTNGLRYSVIDMNLAAGMGSVTAKNVLLYSPSTEKMAATRHCNGHDFWILTHDYNSNSFRAHQLTSAGINTTPVISSIGSIHGSPNPDSRGDMSISPNGKKIALTIAASSLTEVYDFDNSTGVVSNSLILDNSFDTPWGIEFSPNGSKLYVATFPFNNAHIFQFDLCGTSTTSIVNSKIQVANTKHYRGLKLAPNGKIYIARIGDSFLSAITNPNAPGLTCGFVDTAQSVAPNLCYNSLPNMMVRIVEPYTFSASCQQVQFNAVAPTNTVMYNCGTAIFTISGVSWNFGDPASGLSNVSYLSNPSHFYSSPGTYTATLIRQYSCSADTIKAVVTVSASPSFTLTAPTSFCKGETRTLLITPSASYQYSWSPISSSSTSITVSPSATTVYSVTVTDPLTSCLVTKTHTMVMNPCLGINGFMASGTEINIFPNPTDGKLYIQSATTVYVVILDPLGRTVYRSPVFDNQFEVDLSFSAKGVYLLRIESDSVRSYHKVLRY